jgi:hypothetical protein
MSRDNLIKVATGFIAWVNKPQDADAFSAFISKDVNVPIPYPGTTPDYAGLLAMTQAAHVAAPDLKMTIKEMVVDEVKSTVVILIDITGTHVKYLPIRLVNLTIVNGSEFQEQESRSIRWTF